MLKIEKAILCGFLVAVLAMTISGFSAFARQCDDIRGRVFRLHILANSDSQADQTLKLKVRDKILEASGTLFHDDKNKREVAEQARRDLPEIQKIAQDEVAREGFSYPVKVSVVNQYFTTREYGSITFPAGKYDALRVEIGAAKGHNWWCVLFPPLCLPSAESGVSSQDVASGNVTVSKNGKQMLSSVLDPSQVGIVTNGSTQFVIKLKSVELFEQAKNQTRSGLTQMQDKLAAVKNRIFGE